MAIMMPASDQAVLARRAEIVAALRAIVPGEGVIDSASEMRAYESDGLTAYRQPPMVVVLPDTTEQVSLVLKYCAGQGIKVVPRGSGTSLSGRRAAARGRRAARARQVQAHPRDRFRQPRRRHRAGRHQSRHQPGGRACRLLLRPRSVLADRLLDRRQCRGEFRRRALPEIRHDHQQRARLRDCPDERRDPAHRRQVGREHRLRPDGRHHRLGRSARGHHRDHGAHPAKAGDGARADGRLRAGRGGRRMRGAHHRRRHHPRRHGDDGQAGDPRRGGLRPCRLSARRRSAAHHRARRTQDRGRRADHPRRDDRQRLRLDHLPDLDLRGRAQFVLGRPQGRVSGRWPHLARLSLHGRHDSRAARCRRRSPASASSRKSISSAAPTCSTPATAICIR